MFTRLAVHIRRDFENRVVVARLLAELDACSREVVVTESSLRPNEKQYPAADFSHTYDAFVVIGGDGSVLNIVHQMSHFHTPILPISAGTLGFLAEIPLRDFHHTCRRLLKNIFTLDKRALLDVKIHSKQKNHTSFLALNEMVLSPQKAARIATIDAFVNKECLTTYRADGILVATPTGSTAYNLSVGGPILYPHFEAMILSPISPHSLTQKPIVLPKSKSLSFTAHPKNREPLVLTIDGHISFSLHREDSVEVNISAEKVSFLRMPEEHFFKTITRKLHWGILNKA